jgi:hypothetical protein
MATILKVNNYELSIRRLERLEKGASPRPELREKFVENAIKFKAIQDKNIVLGGMHRIRYKDYIHDKEPLALFLNDFKTEIDAIPAINLHYLVKTEAFATIKALMKFNSPRMGRGFPPAIIWDMLDKLPLRYMPYRLYKLEAIRPIEYIPVDDWEEVAKTESNRWQGFRDF